MVCKVCSGPLKRNAKNYCSQRCHGLAVTANAEKARERPCSMCGSLVTHYTKKGGGAICSPACLSELRRRTGKRMTAEGKKPPTFKPTDEERQKRRDRLTGPNAPWWKGGRYENDAGYIMVMAPNDFPWPEMIGAEKRIREHRMVMALHLGRALLRGEVVHHIDGNVSNNNISNLALCGSSSEHTKRYHSRKKD